MSTDKWVIRWSWGNHSTLHTRYDLVNFFTFTVYWYWHNSHDVIITIIFGVNVPVCYYSLVCIWGTAAFISLPLTPKIASLADIDAMHQDPYKILCVTAALITNSQQEFYTSNVFSLYTIRIICHAVNGHPVFWCFFYMWHQYLTFVISKRLSTF